MTETMTAIEVHCPTCKAAPWSLCIGAVFRFHASRHFEAVALLEQLDWIEEVTDTDLVPYGRLASESDAVPRAVTDAISDSIGAAMSEVFGASK